MVNTHESNFGIFNKVEMTVSSVQPWILITNVIPFGGKTIDDKEGSIIYQEGGVYEGVYDDFSCLPSSGTLRTRVTTMPPPSLKWPTQTLFKSHHLIIFTKSDGRNWARTRSVKLLILTASTPCMNVNLRKNWTSIGPIHCNSVCNGVEYPLKWLLRP